MRDGRLNAVLNGSSSSPALNNQFNIITSKPTKGISIRGLAGPYTIVAQNFAPGTTAADIESAMVPIGGTVVSCRLISARPTVIAEIVFESKEGADNVIDTFNNQTVSRTTKSISRRIQAHTTCNRLMDVFFTSTTSLPLPVVPHNSRPSAPRLSPVVQHLWVHLLVHVRIWWKKEVLIARMTDIAARSVTRQSHGLVMIVEATALRRSSMVHMVSRIEWILTTGTTIVVEGCTVMIWLAPGMAGAEVTAGTGDEGEEIVAEDTDEFSAHLRTCVTTFTNSNRHSMDLEDDLPKVQMTGA